jgi:hypothetical protein
MMPNIQMKNKNLSMTYLKMLETSQMLTMIINKEMFFPLVTTMTHRAKLILKMHPQTTERTQLCSHRVKKVMIFLKTLVISQTLIMITNREILSLLDIIMTLKAKLISKITPCNQEMESTQLCSLKINMISQKMLKTSQMLLMIINKETFSPLVTTMILKAKLISKTMQCSQEMESTQ